MSPVDGLYQVYTDLGYPICAGMVVENSRVMRCAPVLREMGFLGRDIYNITSWIAASLGVWKLVKVT